MEPDPSVALAFGIFGTWQARAAGYSDAQIRAEIRRGAWRRIARGVLETIGRDPDRFDDAVRTAVMAGPQATVGLIAAARMYGWELPRLPVLPQVIVPPGYNTRVPAYRARLAADETVVLGPVQVTTPARTAADLAALLPLDEAVVVLDSAMRARVRPAALEEAIGRRRSTAARRALALADPKSGSVPESQARLLFHHAGLPKPDTQFIVQWGGVIHRADFAWPEAMLIVEIDGREFHIAEEPFQADRTHQNAVTRGGWTVVRFTVADVRLRPDYCVDEVAFWLGVNA